MDELNGLASYIFINKPPDHLYCVACKYVARNPTTPDCCGRCFCQGCVKPVKEKGDPCPRCGREITHIMPQVLYKETIEGMQVKCKNSAKGCEWEGLLRELDGHLDERTTGCMFVEVPCHKGCGMKVERGHIETHLNNVCAERQYYCQYCNKPGTYRNICTDHWPECAYKPIQCPNRCGVTCEQSMLEEHTAMCPLSEIQCFYSSAGCTAKFLRKDEEDHSKSSTQHHLELAMKMCLGLKEEQQKIKMTYEKGLQVQAEGFVETLSAVKKEQAEVFNSHEVKLNRLYQEYESKLQNMKMRFEILLRGKNESIRAIKENMESVVDTRVNKEIESFKLVAGILPYNFTVLDVQKKKSENAIWFSPYMLTHPRGYTFLISVRPNGYLHSKDEGVGVWLRSVKGHYDKSLKWPAKVTITLQLLNQNGDYDHVTKNVQFELRQVVEANQDHVCIKEFSYNFLSHGDLGYNGTKKTQYLKYDSLKFRVTEIMLH